MELIFLAIPIVALIALAGLILLGVLVYYIWSKSTLETSWRQLAHRTGLKYRAGGLLQRPSLYGLYRGRKATVDIHSHPGGYKTGSGGYTCTRIRVSINNRTGANLVIREKRFMPSFMKATIPSGDPAFDLQFSIISQRPDLVAQIFKSPGLRARILAVSSFDLEIVGSEMVFEARGILKEVNVLLELFNLITEIAALLERYQ